MTKKDRRKIRGSRYTAAARTGLEANSSKE
jgi:hypothetical protein